VRSAGDLLLIFTVYAPLRSYVIAATIPLGLAALLFLRFLLLISFSDPTRSHAPSLIVAATLAILGFLLVALGVIGEIISVNRRILEEIQSKQRQSDASAGRLSGRCVYELVNSAQRNQQ
jgi:hypothetical protein